MSFQYDDLRIEDNGTEVLKSQCKQFLQMLYGSFFLWYTILVFFHVYTIAASVCPNRRVALWGGSIFIAFGQIPIGAIDLVQSLGQPPVENF